MTYLKMKNLLTYSLFVNNCKWLQIGLELTTSEYKYTLETYLLINIIKHTKNVNKLFLNVWNMALNYGLVSINLQTYFYLLVKKFNISIFPLCSQENKPSTSSLNSIRSFENKLYGNIMLPSFSVLIALWSPPIDYCPTIET